MIRSIRLALAVAAAMAVAVAAAVPAVAAGPGPSGTLTATEYKQLTVEQVAFNKLRHRKRLTWNEFYAVCHKVGRSTDLLQSVRTNCDTGVGIDQSLVGFYADVERCSALSTGTTTGTTTTPTGTTPTDTGTTTTGTTPGTTTTGTTTTGTGGLSPTDFKLLACLQPEYAVIARALKAVYSGQANLRSQVLTRRFVGRCRLTLAPTTHDLGLLKRFVMTAKHLAADVELITKVADGSAPSSSINATHVEGDSMSFNKAGRAFETIKRPQKLSVCPHQ
ncbi:MAG TPA: hypothetical protein VG293_08715 [Solirubrobacteraceae bacterium]|nr:hypothetical protein [Solirubrobacteraceae bacterium]